MRGAGHALDGGGVGGDACPCCDTPLKPGWSDWHRLCPVCGYEGSLLEPHINEAAPGSVGALDEDQRRQALQALRQHNFEALLQMMADLGDAPTRTLLDVGAAHGWFVQACAQAPAPLAWKAVGLEPDEAVAAQAQREGLAVRTGFFPQALVEGAATGLESAELASAELVSADLAPTEPERFDAICFHDVFEHLPRPEEVLQAVRAHLRPGGVLVLNLPSTEGVFFRVARVLARLGLQGPLRRLWQEGMPSPHLHYFNARNLSQLLARTGFEVFRVERLHSIKREGLMARLRYDPRSAWMAPLLGPLLWLAVPLLQRMPPDIRVLMARPRPDASARPSERAGASISR